jgi:uncharacterized protein with HEPN domain
MSRRPEVYLEDISEAIASIESHLQRTPDRDFGEDGMQTDAIVRNLEIIGEAAKKLPEDTKAECPEIEWRKIAGLRDVLIHQYFSVNVEILRDVVENKLPELKRCVEQIESENDP